MLTGGLDSTPAAPVPATNMNDTMSSGQSTNSNNSAYLLDGLLNNSTPIITSLNPAATTASNTLTTPAVQKTSSMSKFYAVSLNLKLNDNCICAKLIKVYSFY